MSEEKKTGPDATPTIQLPRVDAPRPSSPEKETLVLARVTNDTTSEILTLLTEMADRQKRAEERIDKHSESAKRNTSDDRARDATIAADIEHGKKLETELVATKQELVAVKEELGDVKTLLKTNNADTRSILVKTLAEETKGFLKRNPAIAASLLNLLAVAIALVTWWLKSKTGAQ